jgi:hypothetical protein
MTLIAVLFLASMHVLAGRFRRIEHPGWMAGAGGLSLAYVIVELLPDLAKAQRAWLEAWPTRPFVWLESQVYVAVLFGLLLAVGLERTTSRPRVRFGLRLGAFALYNAIVAAFAIHVEGTSALAVAVIAFGSHFVLTDRALARRDLRTYNRIGRWVLVGALVFGWLAGKLAHPPVVLAAGLLGLLAGGIISDIVKEEVELQTDLRAREAQRFGAFALGALGYTAVLIAQERLTA